MSDFTELLADDAADVFLNGDEFAESVRYLPAAGGEREISAVVERSLVYEERAGRTLQVKIAQVHVSDDAATGIATPQRGDGMIDADNVVWDFQNAVTNGSGMWQLEFHAAATHETGRPAES